MACWIGPAYEAGAGRAGGACGPAAMERAKREIDARKPAESNRNPSGSIRLANGARATARSSSRAEGAGVEPGRLRATRFSGPVSAPRRPHLPGIVLAAGIEPEAGCERPGTAPAVSRGREVPRRGIAPRRVAQEASVRIYRAGSIARVGSRTPSGPFRRRPAALWARAWSMRRDSNPGRTRLQLGVNTRFAHAWFRKSGVGRHVGESNPFQLIDNQPAIPIASRDMSSAEDVQGDRRELHPRRLGHNQASWLLEDGHSPPSRNRTSMCRLSGGRTAIVLSVGTR